MVRKLSLLVIPGLLSSILLVATLIPVATMANNHASPPARLLTTSEARLIDAQTIAANRGWDVQATMSRLQRQEAAGPLVAQLAAAYPDTFAGSWFGDGPDEQLFIRFVGSVPAEVQHLAHQLDPDPVLLGNARQSLATLQARTDKLHADLVAQGHPEVVTAFSIREERIIATATRPHGSTRSDQELIAALPEDARAPDVAISFSDGPIAGNHIAAYGGDKISDSATGSWCTSGFTVIESSTQHTGVSSAGHCTMNRYHQEDGTTFSMTFKSEHRGTLGDLEWYETVAPELAEFYSDIGTRRQTHFLESASAIQENNYYCRFGRRTGYKCDHVYLTSVAVTYDGYTHKNLVAMRSDQADRGDSGGPWFILETAAGIHSGGAILDGISRDLWSKADYLNTALGVKVILQ